MMELKELIIVFLLFGIFFTIGHHYGYKKCEDDKIESNPRYFNEKIELEKAIATCNNENKHLDKVYKEYETKLAECVNGLKVSKENELNAIVKYTECYVASEANVNDELKDSKSKCDRRVLTLEKDNAICHTENKNLKKQTVKCEANQDQYEQEIDRLRAEYKDLEIGCHKACIKETEVEKNQCEIRYNKCEIRYNKCEIQYNKCLQSLKIANTNLANSKESKSTCSKLYSNCQEHLKKSKKWPWQ